MPRRPLLGSFANPLQHDGEFQHLSGFSLAPFDRNRHGLIRILLKNLIHLSPGLNRLVIDGNYQITRLNRAFLPLVRGHLTRCGVVTDQKGPGRQAN